MSIHPPRQRAIDQPETELHPVRLPDQDHPDRAEDATAYDVAVIGAGPYGLSVAAHLRALGFNHIVLGRPLDSWREHMPAGMFLKSPWGSASTLSEPSGFYTLERFVQDHGGRVPGKPIPLQVFVDYCEWFQRNAVPEIDQTFVTRLSSAGSGYRLELADGRVLTAPRVVVATGIGHTLRIPEFANGLPPELVSHSFDHDSLEAFRSKEVLIVGAGQSGLESAALLIEAGASVELLVRAPRVSWVHHKFWSRGLGKRLLYAPSDVGPLGLSWLIASAGVIRLLPHQTKRRITTRAVHPAGATWLRGRVEGRVRTTTGTSIRSASPSEGRLNLELSDGSYRTVDHLLLATGFQPQLDRLPFIEAGLRGRIRTTGGMPDLNSRFESSAPGLHFAGAITSGAFGPLTRFVAGAAVTARQIAKGCVRSLRS